MLKLLFCALTLLAIPSMQAQDVPAAKRAVRFQVGAIASSYTLDYNDGREEGVGLFGDVDFRNHVGIEALYRNASIETPHDVGENHFLIGPRLHVTRKRFTPYAKALLGIGKINYQKGYFLQDSSQTYFIVALGGGLDLEATRRIEIRLIDFEYQLWPGFQPHGLTPTGFSVGAAYRF